MSELASLLLLGAVWLGVLFPAHWPLLVVLVVLGGALRARRLVLVLAAAFALASALSARSNELYVPVSHQQFEGQALVIGDPQTRFFSTRVELRLPGGERVFASGPRDLGISALRVGQTVVLDGTLSPAAESDWLRSRHIVGELSVASVYPVSGVVWWLRPSNAIRGWVAGGARLMSGPDGALYNGLVVGDDRDQSASQRSLFRSGGLTHLLAVSGQNVAFALAVVSPLLARLSHRSRLVVTLGVLIVFALATRLEPSVMRASATAALAAWATQSGRRTTGVQILSLACSLLLLLDPFLGRSIGFQLSVAASLAILIFAPAVASRLVGPQVLRDSFGVTLAAQLGVAPILVTNFGPMSASSVPANLAAGPVAGLVMTWGLSLGLIANALPRGAGVIVQLPAVAGVRWISGVSQWAAHLPLPLLDLRHLSAVLLAGAGIWALGGSAERWRWVLRVLSGGALLWSLVGLVPRPPDQPVDYAGSNYYPGDGDSPSVLVLTTGSSRALITGLLADRVFTVDLVVATGGGYQSSVLLSELGSVVEIGDILAPPQHRIVGARLVDNEVQIESAWGPIGVEPSDDREHLEVELPRSTSEGARFSPDG